jgi:hypothetical protein
MTRKRLVWLILGVAAVYGIVCGDVVLRARHAYVEGEMAENPREAYAWYESAATLFVPPESKWSRLARERMPITREKWKDELRSKHIPFTDAQLE